MADGSKSARTRQRLLDAGARLFRERGYANTRLSDIADAAGIRTGSMYYYFSSREQLVLEILQVGVDNAWHAVDAALAALPPGAAARDRLHTAIRAHVTLVLETSDYASAHPRIMGEVPAAVRDQHLARQREYGDRWQSLFEDAQRTGDIDPAADLFVARLMVFSAMNSLAGLRRPADDAALERVAEQAATMLTTGLAARADRNGGQE
ncbi:MAG: TetR/AcrR family transcriptional regulator [Actinobacteria bacterium]|nr:TetR/AcrR family transcriptional regulator [Actinomycetota bacterium]